MRALRVPGDIESLEPTYCATASLSHTKSYGTEVGLTTKKRRVLRTFVPSDSNSITLVAGSSGPREPSGPGISGDLS